MVYMACSIQAIVLRFSLNISRTYGRIADGCPQPNGRIIEDGFPHRSSSKKIQYMGKHCHTCGCRVMTVSFPPT